MTTLDDDDLRAMLEARAEHVAVDPVAVIAEGRRLDSARSATGPSARRIVPSLLGIGAVVATVAVILTLAMPTSVRPTGSATVSEDATPITKPSAVPSTIDGAVTADGLSRLLGERDMVGRIVFLDGALVPARNACTASPWCGRMIVGLIAPHSVLPDARIAAESLLASYDTKGLYALDVGGTSAAGFVGFTVLGRVAPNGETVLWPIEMLAAGRAPKPSSDREQIPDLVEVTGWIVRTPLHSCPSTFRTSCRPTEDYLTVEPYQPVRPDGSVSGPQAETSINLVSGSYDDWAPEPTRLGLGVEPQRVTLLLRRIGPCPPTTRAICVLPPGDLWTAAARLDPP